MGSCTGRTIPCQYTLLTQFMNPPIARYLDAAILKPDMQSSEAQNAMRECIALGVKTICVRPCDIPLAKNLCAGTKTGVSVVLGFPHGDQLTESKADEARRYIALGVDEIDMVANYGWIRSGLWNEVQSDISAVTALTKPAGIPLKVIFETAQLEKSEIQMATETSVLAGADFVKTSTGFGGEGAKREDVILMVKTSAGRVQVKASGGIRTFGDARDFLELGATRLGVGYAACSDICLLREDPDDLRDSKY